MRKGKMQQASFKTFYWKAQVFLLRVLIGVLKGISASCFWLSGRDLFQKKIGFSEVFIVLANGLPGLCSPVETWKIIMFFIACLLYFLCFECTLNYCRGCMDDTIPQDRNCV
jgi:hypothetical protein